MSEKTKKQKEKDEDPEVREISITFRREIGTVDIGSIEIRVFPPNKDNRLYRDEKKWILNTVAAAFDLVAIDRPRPPWERPVRSKLADLADMMPDPLVSRHIPKDAPNVAVEQIQDLVKEEERKKELLEDSIGMDLPPMSDTEDEIILRLVERHEVDWQTVKQIRERVRVVLTVADRRGDSLAPETENEIVSQAGGMGLPDTTVMDLVEDLIENFLA